jgi:hypothetical protein
MRSMCAHRGPTYSPILTTKSCGARHDYVGDGTINEVVHFLMLNSDSCARVYTGIYLSYT